MQIPETQKKKKYQYQFIKPMNPSVVKMLKIGKKTYENINYSSLFPQVPRKAFEMPSQRGEAILLSFLAMRGRGWWGWWGWWGGGDGGRGGTRLGRGRQENHFHRQRHCTVPTYWTDLPIKFNWCPFTLLIRNSVALKVNDLYTGLSDF